MPSIEDEDIDWVSKLLSVDFDKDRRDVLRSTSTVDIQACPGSGKTTLLIAKLAIVAKKWVHRDQGLCILSHTNVAREEIEIRLGSTCLGQQLLSYPHFVGTIHAFVNQFLALPWLRSEGKVVSVIEDGVTLAKRWSDLRWVTRDRLPGADSLRASTIDGKPGTIPWGRGALKEGGKTYQEIYNVIRDSMDEGYYTFDEIFLAAADALERCKVAKWVRQRFPVCFVDEAQDCSEEQNEILAKLYPSDEGGVVYQRFGDGNQAIYNHADASGASTDLFPRDGDFLKVSDSRRLSPVVAKLVDPLGLMPYRMKGSGGSLDSNPPGAVFLYGSGKEELVLPAYGDLLLSTFSDESLKRNCYAIGQVHKIKDTLNVSSYWGGYDPDYAKNVLNFVRLSDSLRHSVYLSRQYGSFSIGMNVLARSFIGFLRKNSSGIRFPKTKFTYRVLMECLDERGGDCDAFLSWLRLLFSCERIEKGDWENKIQAESLEWLKKFGATGVSSRNEFLQWGGDSRDVSSKGVPNRPNIFSYENCGRSVDIRMGSIHSVKGQTHLATLVLDTFWRGRDGKSNLSYLIDWLTGKKSGVGKEGVQNQTRLKCHYVAMSRPTDLLGVAIAGKSVSNTSRQRMVEFGWRLIDV